MRALRVIGAGLLVASTAAWGQGIMGGFVGAAPPSAVNLGQRVDPNNPLSLPHSYEITTTNVEFLANGGKVTHSTVRREMRDSQGRMRTESQMQQSIRQSVRGEDGKTYFYMQPQAEPMMVITVQDPVKNVFMSWTTGGNNNKVVTVRQQRPANTPPPPPPPPAPARVGPGPVLTPMPSVPPPMVQRQRAVEPAGALRAAMDTEDLGSKNVQGLILYGHRTTTHFPAGFDGNDLAYDTVSENWTPTLRGGAPLEMHSEQPGRTMTQTLTSYSPGDPDASEFEAPAGYAVREIPAPGSAVLP